MPERVFMRNIIGPTSPIPEDVDDAVVEDDGRVSASAVLGALRDMDRALDSDGAVPSSVDVGGRTFGPGQVLNGLRDLYAAARTGRTAGSVELSGPNLPVIADEEFFAQEVFTRPIYTEGFEGRNICRMCRLQSWSWKPALKV